MIIYRVRILFLEGLVPFIEHRRRVLIKLGHCNCVITNTQVVFKYATTTFCFFDWRMV